MTHPSTNPRPEDVQAPNLGRMFNGAPVPTQISVAMLSGPGQPTRVTLIVETPTGIFGVPLDGKTAIAVGDMLRGAGLRASLLAGNPGAGQIVIPSVDVDRLGLNGSSS